MSQLIGGPYDGMMISVDEINEHICPDHYHRLFPPLKDGDPSQLFIFLPNKVEDWERVKRGEITMKNGVNALQVYKRVSVSDGFQFHESMKEFEQRVLVGQ